MKIKKIIKELELIPVGTEIFFNGEYINCHNYQYKKTATGKIQSVCPHGLNCSGEENPCDISLGNPLEKSLSDFSNEIESFLGNCNGSSVGIGLTGEEKIYFMGEVR